METILQYIKDPVINIKAKDLIINNAAEKFSFNERKFKKKYQKFVELYNRDAAHDKDLAQTKKVQLKIIPKTKRTGQIWLCKQTFIDYLGNDVQGVCPYYVLIVREPEIIENTDAEFVRVQPVSMFTEFQAFDDILIDDASITGFPFLIETWNEQPVLTSILEEYITKLSRKVTKKNKQFPFADEQKKFRELEVNNTSYLRQSVLSVLSWLENKQEKNSGVLINLFGKTYYPAKSAKDLFNARENVDFAVAARKSINPLRDNYKLQQEVNGHMITITVIKDDNKFIVVLEQPGESELIDAAGNMLQGIKKNKNQIFQELDPGRYELSNKIFNKTIKIRLQ